MRTAASRVPLAGRQTPGPRCPTAPRARPGGGGTQFLQVGALTRPLRAGHRQSSSLCPTSLPDRDSPTGLGGPSWASWSCSWERSTSSGLKSIFTRSSACTRSCEDKPPYSERPLDQALTSQGLLPGDDKFFLHGL